MPLFLVLVGFVLVFWWATRVYGVPVRRTPPRDAGPAAGPAPGPDAARPRAPRPEALDRVRTRSEALKVLDLPEGATADEVEERYRKLRRSTHPDNFPRAKYPASITAVAEAEFKRLGEARDLLLGRR